MMTVWSFGNILFRVILKNGTVFESKIGLDLIYI